MTLEIENGSSFPDLKKAGLVKSIEDLIKGLLDKDQEFFELAQTKKTQLNKQRAIDLKSFWESQKGAIERGNTNACNTRHKFSDISVGQTSKVVAITMPQSKNKKLYGIDKKQTNLPKTRYSSPTSGARSRPPSMQRVNFNQPVSVAIDKNSHVIETVTPPTDTTKAERNMSAFVRAQAGKRGTSIGDRAIVFTANGTPLYGDTYLDRNLTENLAANQATSNAPIIKIPNKVETGNKIGTNQLQQQPRANVHPKSDSVGNMLILGGIATAVTAILFLFQYVLMFVQLILQISSVTSTITNIAGSFVAILNNVGSLFGLGEGVIDPLEKTFDSVLNNVFGKEKVDYVKYQFAKVSSAFVAGQNMINKLSGLHNSMATVTEGNANNTSKIGNALKSMGMLANGDGWMSEDNKVNNGVGKLGTKLESVSGLASSLSEITADVKTATQSQKDLDKDFNDKEKESKKAEEKAIDKHTDKEIPDLLDIGGGS